MGLYCVLHESGAPTRVSHRLHRLRSAERRALLEQLELENQRVRLVALPTGRAPLGKDEEPPDGSLRGGTRRHRPARQAEGEGRRRLSRDGLENGIIGSCLRQTRRVAPRTLTQMTTHRRAEPTSETLRPTGAKQSRAYVKQTPICASSSGIRVAPKPIRENSQPTLVRQTPTRVTSAPTRVAPKPIRENSQPTLVRQTPTRVTSAPTRVAPKPIRENSQPTLVRQTPTRVTCAPTSVAFLPIRVN